MTDTKITIIRLTDEDKLLINKRINTSLIFIFIWLSLASFGLWAVLSAPIDWILLIITLIFASFGLFPFVQLRHFKRALNNGVKTIVTGRVEKIDYRVGYSHLPTLFYVGGQAYSPLGLDVQGIKAGISQDTMVEIELLENIELPLRIRKH